jgi:hypothetical protein
MPFVFAMVVGLAALMYAALALAAKWGANPAR